jgi:hypothetical protein
MPRELSEKQKKAMQAGRRRAGESRRQEAIQRVQTFRAWNQDDAENGTPGNRKPIPTIPSDTDYEVARAEGAI